jgi:hypothetical protein
MRHKTFNTDHRRPAAITVGNLTIGRHLSGLRRRWGGGTTGRRPGFQPLIGVDGA